MPVSEFFVSKKSDGISLRYDHTSRLFLEGDTEGFGKTVVTKNFCGRWCAAPNNAAALSRLM